MMQKSSKQKRPLAFLSGDSALLIFINFKNFSHQRYPFPLVAYLFWVCYFLSYLILTRIKVNKNKKSLPKGGF